MTILIEAIERTNNDVVKILSAFSQQQLNVVPFAGSWTAAQVADHIYKFQSGIPQLMNGETRATKRKPDEHEPALKAMFLDFTIKMQAPEFVVPTNEPQQKEVLIDKINNTTKAITETMQALDLSETCLAYSLPGGFGELTRMEWGYFILYHTQRHLRQLGNIYEAIGDK
jgi:hypothetical protein